MTSTGQRSPAQKWGASGMILDSSLNSYRLRVDFPTELLDWEWLSCLMIIHSNIAGVKLKYLSSDMVWYWSNRAELSSGHSLP